MKKKKQTLQTETVQTEGTAVKKDAVKTGKNAAETKKALTMKNKKRAGTYIRLILGLLFLLLGLWLWTKTLGTQLLFTDVTIGRISRYWFVPLIFGLALLMTAVYSVMRKPRQAQEEKEEPTSSEAAARETESTAETTADVAGTENAAETPGTEAETERATEAPGTEDDAGNATEAPESVTGTRQTLTAESGMEKI